LGVIVLLTGYAFPLSMLLSLPKETQIGSTGSYKGTKDIVLGILSVQELLKISHFAKNGVNFDEMGENGDFDLYFQEYPINFFRRKVGIF